MKLPLFTPCSTGEFIIKYRFKIEKREERGKRKEEEERRKKKGTKVTTRRMNVSSSKCAIS